MRQGVIRRSGTVILQGHINKVNIDIKNINISVNPVGGRGESGNQAG